MENSVNLDPAQGEGGTLRHHWTMIKNLGVAALVMVAACGLNVGSSASKAPKALDLVARQLAGAVVAGAAEAPAWSSVDVGAGPSGAVNGAAAFRRYCAACHGEGGDGAGAIGLQMRVHPRDLTAGVFRLKSTADDAPPSDADLFRTLTVGIPLSGMPAFGWLDAETRWALVAHVKSLSKAFAGAAPAPLDLHPEPSASAQAGEALYAHAICTQCHGPEGRGDGPIAKTLPEPPTNFRAGPQAFKGGAKAVDVFRTLSGFAGSPMASFAHAGFSRADLWSLALHVASLAERGGAEQLQGWRTFLDALGMVGEPPLEPADAPRTPKADGCLRCHESVEVINDKMQPALVAFGAGRPGAACAVCHEGNPDGATRREAHAGLIPNPGSLWVVGLGMGCAKCHAAGGSLTTFQGKPLPAAVGGKLMDVVSRVSDPTGATGFGHAYRVPRGLMAAELGKATTSLRTNGVIQDGPLAFADVAGDDPDGPAPLVGSPAYRAWVKKAMDAKFLRHIERVEQMPAYAEGLEKFHSPEDAAIGQFFRQDCSRCHLWDRGFPGAGGRHRSEGCSACHVLYAADAPGRVHKAQGASAERVGPLAHRITAQIPSSQCSHCHWRGNGYYADLHYERGMECTDCHGSVDMHGDGNIYPTMHLQVETACEDCHGTVKAYPWELPVGYGTPLPNAEPRGVAEVDGGVYLLTSKGNARANWVRRGDQAFVLGQDGKDHPIPLLRVLHDQSSWKTEVGRVAMDGIPAHLEKMECNACHVRKAVQCQGCHVTVDMQRKGVDWTASLSNRATPWGAASHPAGIGASDFTSSPKALVEPTLGLNLQGRVTGLVPGCLLDIDLVTPEGKRLHVDGQGLTAAGLPKATLAPLIPHATALVARSCESCNTNPAALGYGVGMDRGAPADPPHVRERLPRPPNVRPALDWASAPGEHGIEHGSEQGGGALIDFSAKFDVNRLVTREGGALKKLVDPGEGPLRPEQRDHAERQGVCLACHRLNGSKEWAAVKAKLGAAVTPAQHDQAVQAILDSYVRSAAAKGR